MEAIDLAALCCVVLFSFIATFAFASRIAPLHEESTQSSASGTVKTIPLTGTKQDAKQDAKQAAASRASGALSQKRYLSIFLLFNF